MSAPRYGIRIRKKASDNWRRGKQYKRKGRRWVYWRDSWPSKAAANMRLAMYRLKGWKGHTFVLPSQSWRVEARRVMRWALEHEPSIHYLQSRPFDVDAFKKRKVPMSADCSATTTMIYRDAGRPDPNGNDYDGTGYTGTLRAHTPEADGGVDSLKVGDFIVYGPGSGAHVVVVYEPGADPLTWSHGQEAGPILVRHSVEVAVHGSYFTIHDGDALR